MSLKKEFVGWLNNAYSMELSLAEVLDKHAKHADGYPVLQGALYRHVMETRQQADRIKSCIELLGEPVSTAKAVLGDLLGKINGMAAGMFKDEIVKNVLTEYAAEHFEIACYRSLIAAAEDLNQPAIAEVCRRNLAEEEAMAQWLAEQIPIITKEYLNESHLAYV